MAELETKITDASINDDQKIKDAFEILAMMNEVTRQEPGMWGDSITGSGEVPMKYETGRELDWFTMSFSAGKQNISLYLYHCADISKAVRSKPGKFKTGKSCLYINKLADVNSEELKSLFKQGVAGRS